MAVWYVDSAQWTAVTAWAAATAKSAGNLIRQNTTPTIGNERVFVCIVAGTTHATTEPTWTVTKGAKTTDNTVTWQECTGQPGVNGDLVNCPLSSDVRSTNLSLGRVIQNNSGTHLFIVSTDAGSTGASEPTYDTTAGNTTTDSGITWTCIGAVGNFAAFDAPHSRIANAYATNWGVAGDTFYVGDDHAWTQAAALTVTSPATTSPVYVICVDHTIAAPYATGDLRTTATESTTGNSAISWRGGGYYYGLGLRAGSGAGTLSTVTIRPDGKQLIFDNCNFKRLGTTATTSAIGLGLANTTTAQDLILKDTTLEFGTTGDGVAVNGNILWKGSSSSLVAGTIPTILFSRAFSAGVLNIYGVDLSNLGSGTLFGTSIGALTATLVNCKLGASYVIAGTLGSGVQIDIVNCDSGATNYLFSRYQQLGNHITKINPVRTGGASDGTTSVSWLITTTSSAFWSIPFQCQKLAIWNSTLATDRVVTIYGLWDSGSLPNNDDIWINCEYLGSSATPIASMKSSTKASVVATNAALSADTSAWDGAATARANTTAYSLGDIFKVASNSGRVFFCTTAGTTAGSEPGGYATAVDGDSITDNTATFRAARRFTMAVTLTSPQPAMEGYIYVYVTVGKTSSAFYIDPSPVLS